MPRVGLAYELPLQPEHVEVNGEKRESVLSSRIFAGINWVPLYVDFAGHSRVDLQLLTSMGVRIEEAPDPVPPVAGRALLQNAVEGVDMYFGGYYELVIDKVGFLYGVGYRFRASGRPLPRPVWRQHGVAPSRPPVVGSPR